MISSICRQMSIQRRQQTILNRVQPILIDTVQQLQQQKQQKQQQLQQQQQQQQNIYYVQRWLSSSTSSSISTSKTTKKLKRKTKSLNINSDTTMLTSKEKIRRMIEHNERTVNDSSLFNSSTGGTTRSNNNSKNNDELNNVLETATHRLQFMQTKLYQFWNPDYGPSNGNTTGSRSTTSTSTGSSNSVPVVRKTRPVKPGVLMDTKWWFWNILFALLPPISIALYCELVGRPRMEQYYNEQEMNQMVETMGSQFANEYESLQKQIPKDFIISERNRMKNIAKKNKNTNDNTYDEYETVVYFIEEITKYGNDLKEFIRYALFGEIIIQDVPYSETSARTRTDTTSTTSTTSTTDTLGSISRTNTGTATASTITSTDKTFSQSTGSRTPIQDNTTSTIGENINNTDDAYPVIHRTEHSITNNNNTFRREDIQELLDRIHNLESIVLSQSTNVSTTIPKITNIDTKVYNSNSSSSNNINTQHTNNTNKQQAINPFASNQSGISRRTGTGTGNTGMNKVENYQEQMEELRIIHATYQSMIQQNDIDNTTYITKSINILLPFIPDHFRDTISAVLVSVGLYDGLNNGLYSDPVVASTSTTSTGSIDNQIQAKNHVQTNTRSGTSNVVEDTMTISHEKPIDVPLIVMKEDVKDIKDSNDTKTISTARASDGTTGNSTTSNTTSKLWYQKLFRTN